MKNQQVAQDFLMLLYNKSGPDLPVTLRNMLRETGILQKNVFLVCTSLTLALEAVQTYILQHKSAAIT